MSWIMPNWMEKYAGTIIPDKKTCEWHMNDNKTNVLVNAPLALNVIATKNQVQTIAKLHNAYPQLNEEMTKIKFLHELDVEIQDEEIEEENRLVSFTICECMKCHWTFTDDCHREGYGYTWQGTQIPNYCPMCGSRLDGDC